MRLGVCYYPEHWHEDRWPDDARAMRALGISTVRVGDFAWSRLEPEPGRFDWQWLDRAVDTLAAAGLRVVMCTPTAAPPKWLVDRCPEILPIGADGRPRRFGSRRHYDFSSSRYREEALRITEALAHRLGRHPGIVAWQVDNEYGCHDTVLSWSHAATVAFRRWLQERYVTVDALNRAWGTVFWSAEYRTFSQVDPPGGEVAEANPAHRLDWRRFASDEVRRFHEGQVEVLRRLAPGRKIIHNFQQLFTQFDHYPVAASCDVAAWDSYPVGALETSWFDGATKLRWLRTGHPDFTGFHHDLYRGMSREPFWVMEQQPGPVNWAPWNPAPLAGMVRLWTWEAFAHGADVVSYFRWRQCPFGQEQFHAGLHTPDGALDVGGEEVARVARELPGVAAAPVQRAPAALLFDYDAQHVYETLPQGAGFSALRAAYEAYSALRGLGLDVDVLPVSAPLDGYRLVVIPSLPILPDDLPARLAAAGAQVVALARTGSKTRNLSIPESLPPGVLQALVPVQVVRVESLRPGVVEAVDFAGRAHQVTLWREHLRPLAGAAVDELARFRSGGAAVVRHGRASYLAGVPDAALLSAVLAGAARDAGLQPVRLPDGLRLRRRGALTFAVNYGPESADTPAPRDATFLVGGPRLGVADVAVWCDGR